GRERALDCGGRGVNAELAMAWQPISTAPKDGSLVLTWDGKEYGFAFWNPSSDPDRSGSDNPEYFPGWEEPDNPGFVAHHLTHWMPLPPRAEGRRVMIFNFHFGVRNERHLFKMAAALCRARDRDVPGGRDKEAAHQGLAEGWPQGLDRACEQVHRRERP